MVQGFNDKCPICEGIMADGNKYCCHECWLKDNLK